MKLLIADDDTVGRLILQATLKQWGHEVIAARDGAEALAHLADAEIAPIWIVDWNMPGTNGLDVCRAIRNKPELSAVYLIILTGNNRREDVVEAIKAGADDYVVKPFDPEELRIRVNAGIRIVNLQCEAREAAALARQLEGLLPLCRQCGKRRDDAEYWKIVAAFQQRGGAAAANGLEAAKRPDAGLCLECGGGQAGKAR